MLKYESIYIGQKATEYGFVRDTLEKVLRLADVLYFLNTHPVLKQTLSLKGGTAINFTVFNLPRLSVDIDLDYFMDVNRDIMLQHRNEISNLIEQQMLSFGYFKDTRSKITHSLDSFVYSYTGISGNKDNIKIEINYSLRVHIFENDKRAIHHELIKRDILINTLAPIELYASKIVALINRAAARDLYDVWKMIRENKIQLEDQTMLRKCVIFYAAISSNGRVNNFSLASIESINSRRIKTDLLPVISRSDHFQLETAKDEVKLYILQLMELTETEKEFLIKFEKGFYQPEILFSDPNIVKRIKNHPMAVWKTREY